MRKTRRRATAIAASIAAAGILTAATAWACTPLGHQGSIWWCNTSPGCSSPATAVFTYARGTSAFYGSASGMQKFSTTYRVRYQLIDPMFLLYNKEHCNLSPTSLGTAITDAAGAWSAVPMTLPTPPTASQAWYEVCAQPDTPTGYLDAKGAIHTSILVT